MDAGHNAPYSAITRQDLRVTVSEYLAWGEVTPHPQSLRNCFRMVVLLKFPLYVDKLLSMLPGLKA
eukprot:168172-Amphidinium_carterae.1